MCEYFSAIVTQGGKALWLKDRSPSHENIVEEYKLKDDTIENRTWVRIEITPKNKEKVTRRREDWVFKVDEKGTLPEWWVFNPDKFAGIAWAAWEESVKEQLVLNEEERIVSGNAYLEAYGSAHVEAYGSAHVEACDSAHVEAYGSAHVEACDSAHVEAYDSAQVQIFWGSPQIKLLSDSAVVTKGGRIYVRNINNVSVAEEVN